MDVGQFVAVNVYIFNVFVPLNFLGTIYNMVVKGLVDIKNLSMLLAEKASGRLETIKSYSQRGRSTAKMGWTCTLFVVDHHTAG